MAALLTSLHDGAAHVGRTAQRTLDDALRFANREDLPPTPEGTPAAGVGWGAPSPAPPLSPTPVPTPGAGER
jgi:hypothetical protein